MKKFILLILVISSLILNVSVYSQDPPPPTLGAGEHWTNLYSQSYDYQTNGSVRYLVQDPANAPQMCAILMAQQDSNSAVGVQRYIYYSYTTDNGNTWTASVLDASTNWGFPDMSLRNGIPIIATHQFGLNLSFAFRDLSFGAFSFELINGVPPGPVWPHLSGTTNGNIVMAAAPNDNVFIGQYTTYNGSSWSAWTTLPLVGGPSGNFSVESGTGGIVGIFGTDYINTGYLYYYKSTDNGVTFDNGTLVFNYLVEGGDTLFANIVGGLQAVYKGNEPHIAFSVWNVSSDIFPNPNTIAYIKPKILHWSPSTGITQIAGKFNISNLTDTITTLLMTPVCQPSISATTSGNLICTFTTFLRGNTQIVDNGDELNAGEIFSMFSPDNGVTWYNPVNQTNTPSIEEKHSSLINHATTADTLKVHYLRDLKAGGWVNNAAWGKAPVYGIYKHAYIGTIGINEINSQAKSYELYQNYPNPFNPTTTIKFDIPKSSFTSLIVYDNNGREITRLVNQKLNSGSYEYEFSINNHQLSSGVYYYKLIAGDFIDTKKMILIK